MLREHEYRRAARAAAGACVLLAALPAAAHNPIFAPGPHVTYAGGTELTLGYERARTSGAGSEETDQEAVLELEYGLTADWTAEIELPFRSLDEGGREASGLGDVVLRSRWRFHRLDLPSEQRAAALLVQVKLPSGDEDERPRLGSGSTDFLAGLLYGREGRRWYYYGAARYRFNTEGAGGLERGDRQLLDLVGGVRPFLTGYREPDTVLFLELNFENAGRDERGGVALADTGGWELFLSPGVFWTYRNFALRSGVQLPIAEGLNGRQPESRYRFKFELRYQF